MCAVSAASSIAVSGTWRYSQTCMRACICDEMPMQQRRNNHVVLDAERRKWPHNLKRATNATTTYLIGRQAVDPLA